MVKKPDGLSIGVLTHRSRRCLIRPHLQDLNPLILYNQDYAVPPDIILCAQAWQLQSPIVQLLGHYRAYRGHQEIMKQLESDVLLIFEDDAVPNCSNWWEYVLEAMELLTSYEVVSLHGRRMQHVARQFLHNERTYLEIAPSRAGLKFAAGSCLAYLITRPAARRFYKQRFNGIPNDLSLVNYFTACIIEHSPFDHGDGQASVIERSRPAGYFKARLNIALRYPVKSFVLYMARARMRAAAAIRGSRTI